MRNRSVDSGCEIGFKLLTIRKNGLTEAVLLALVRIYTIFSFCLFFYSFSILLQIREICPILLQVLHLALMNLHSLWCYFSQCKHSSFFLAFDNQMDWSIFFGFGITFPMATSSCLIRDFSSSRFFRNSFSFRNDLSLLACSFRIVKYIKKSPWSIE